jgi:predicted dehydrogenase
MSQLICRWGILGTANIARKNWQAIRNSANATLVAVASRDRTRAQQFIDECQVQAAFQPSPAALGGYEELLQRPDIDAVYIPLPTGIRKEWVVRAANAGKHVLCEKPCGANVEEVRAILDACDRKRVQFMDGVMFMHSQRLALLRQVIDDHQSIGAVRRIASQFSFLAGDDFYTRNIRVSSALEPLGCLGDLGWYNIRFSLWVMNQQMPESVSGRLLTQQGRSDSEQVVPIEFSGELFFPGGVTASFYCSFRTETQQWANIGGTRGQVQIADFVLPFFGSETSFEVSKAVFQVQGCQFNMENHSCRFAVHEYSNNWPNSQEANMIQTFSQIVLSGQLQPQWGEMALKTQSVVDACLCSSREDGKRMSMES